MVDNPNFIVHLVLKGMKEQIIRVCKQGVVVIVQGSIPVGKLKEQERIGDHTKEDFTLSTLMRGHDIFMIGPWASL